MPSQWALESGNGIMRSGEKMSRFVPSIGLAVLLFVLAALLSRVPYF